MHSGQETSRREFLQVISSGVAGLVIGFYLPVRAESQLNAGSSAPNPFSAWIHITTDGAVTLLMCKSEMGQGVMTSLPMILAEELDVDWSHVCVQQAPTNPNLYRHGTGGSTSSFRSWLPLRKAGAAAREMLINAAARAWKVPSSECDTEKGTVIHGLPSRKLTYGSLVKTACELPIPDFNTVRLKKSEMFNLVGRDMHRVD